MVWIPGRTYLVDPGTEIDTVLAEALQLLRITGKIPLYLTKTEVQSSDHPFEYAPL